MDRNLPFTMNPLIPNLSLFQRQMQISESHCGPAALQMLLSIYGLTHTQEEITRACNAVSTIEEEGVTVEQMGMAVNQLFPQLSFYFKRQADFNDINILINKFHLPVGVEWQGAFIDPNGGYKTPDNWPDLGHYSVVVAINPEQNYLVISDPYKHFAYADRKFSTTDFALRWWDEYDLEDPETGRSQTRRDQNLLFVVSPSNLTLPQELKLTKSTSKC
jgi:hypothetical protein